jgi:death-on-curing protein
LLPPPSNTPSRSTPPPSAGSPTDGAVRYLTTQDVIELHRAVSVEFGGNQALPGVVDSQYGLLNSTQRPQVTIMGKEAYPTFADKAAAFLFALLQNSPFRSGNRRVALTALVAFCEVNNRVVDVRVADEKTVETMIKRVSASRDLGLPPESVFREIRELLSRAIASA